MAELLWSDRKRTIFGLPWSFTKYKLTEEKLMIESGLLNVRADEIRLYRITDVAMNKSLFQRIFGVGCVHVISADRSVPDLDMIVKKPDVVKETLSDAVEAERMKKRVSNREFMSSDSDMDIL